MRLTAAESTFLASSVAAVDASRQADVLRLRRLRRLVTATGVALVVALIAGGVALRQRNNAQSSANEARSPKPKRSKPPQVLTLQRRKQTRRQPRPSSQR